MIAEPFKQLFVKFTFNYPNKELFQNIGIPNEFHENSLQNRYFGYTCYNILRRISKMSFLYSDLNAQSQLLISYFFRSALICILAFQRYQQHILKN